MTQRGGGGKEGESRYYFIVCNVRHIVFRRSSRQGDGGMQGPLPSPKKKRIKESKIIRLLSFVYTIKDATSFLSVCFLRSGYTFS